MRGADTFTESLFTMRHLDDFVPADQPLRVIRVMVNEALANMDELFAQMYGADIKGGRPSIAPGKLLRAMLIQVLYSVRSERQLMEQTQYNLLFRWFIGLAMDDAVWLPNRHGLVVSAVVTQADGYAEREAAKAMINDARQALPGDEPITITLGADKGYDGKEFIQATPAAVCTESAPGGGKAIAPQIGQPLSCTTPGRE